MLRITSWNFRQLAFLGVVIVLGSSGLVVVNSDDDMEFQKILPAHVVWAVSGQDAELPCNVTPPDMNDKVNMVFWFKDSTGMPLYSLDAREGSLDKAHHLAISSDLGCRTYFHTAGPRMARLHVRNVSLQDEGVFRCRIDFQNSPTINFRINLTIAVQPSMPEIYDNEGREVMATAGPFLEGYELFLKCNVTGGRPRPEVTWWQGDELRDKSVDFETATTTINHLLLITVPRTLWNSHLECRAQSSNLTKPVVRRVPLDIYLKPRKVQIVTKDTLLSAGKPHVLQCDSSGSVPPARLTWLLDGVPIRENVLEHNKGLNTSSSILSLRPRASDDGRELACRAVNPHFLGGLMEEQRRLHVAYAPVVSVQLETTSALTALKEGDEVRLTCEVRANPQPDRITWYHERQRGIAKGGLLEYNESSGVLPDDRTLRLRAVTRSSAGEYSCAAGNREGETRSSAIRIRVHFAPRCRKGYETQRLGALRHKSLTARCVVEADPGGENVKFFWTFNNSREVVRIPAANVSSKGLSSMLQYEPHADLDFGTLMCWAINSVGQQQVPCFVHVVLAKTPQPPTSCGLRNHSSGRMEVACVPGDDGDLPQHFVLEVSEPVFQPPPAAATLSDQALPHLLYRMLGAEPLFSLDSLKPGRDYQLTVFAENAKGRSDPPVVIPSVRVATTMEMERLKGTDVEDEEQQAASTQPMAIILGVLISAAVLILAGIFMTAALVTCRRRAALSKLEEVCPADGAKPPSIRRSLYGEDATPSFPRPRCLSERLDTRTSGIEDEGGGNLPSLHEPDLIISRAELVLDSSVPPASC